MIHNLTDIIYNNYVTGLNQLNELTEHNNIIPVIVKYITR